MLNHFSCVQLFVTPWTVAHQAPLSMGFSSKNTGVSCHALLQGIFLTQGLNPLLLWILLVGEFFTAEPQEKPLQQVYLIVLLTSPM